MAKDTVSQKTILSYGILSLAIGVIGVPMGIYLAPFYAGELGLSLAVIGYSLTAKLRGRQDYIVDKQTNPQAQLPAFLQQATIKQTPNISL